MLSRNLLPTSGLHMLGFVSYQDLIEIRIRSREPSSNCPSCGVASSRIHARYYRTVADLPWHGVVVRLRLHARKFKCLAPGCPRRIFSERLPALVAPYARQTQRLAQAIRLLGFALGGRPAARLAAELGLRAGPDTMIRAVRRAPTPTRAVPRVLGVDDWAIRRGHTYGTILIDLETRRPVDVLRDRESATLAAWLREHPGVEVISRDRGGCYGEGAAQGAPFALQVADRWHLLKNLGEAVERFLAREHKAVAGVRYARGAGVTDQATGAEAEPAPTQPSDTKQGWRWRRAEEHRRENRSRRLARYEKVKSLFAQGHSMRGIARQTGLNAKTVSKFVESKSFPERRERRPRLREIDAFVPYLAERWAEGCRNATLLWQELQGRGFRGTLPMVRRQVSQWRSDDGRRQFRHDAAPGQKPARRAESLSPRAAKWLLLGRRDEDDEGRARLRQRLHDACPAAAEVGRLAEGFRAVVRERDVAALDGWLREAKASKVRDLTGFAVGLERDRGAVEAALSLPWSNGPVEGHVNRVKAIKRSMYGRAKFDLLRKRILGCG